MVNPKIYFEKIEDALELSTRALNCLKRNDINYVWQLVERTEKSLLCIEGLGLRTFKEILDELKKKGLTLREEGSIEPPSYDFIPLREKDVSFLLSYLFKLPRIKKKLKECLKILSKMKQLSLRNYIPKEKTSSLSLEYHRLNLKKLKKRLFINSLIPLQASVYSHYFLKKLEALRDY